MLLPEPRGPITQHLQAVGGVDVDKVAALLDDVDASSLDSDDVQLALWTLYEMHFQGFEDVDPRAEWDPDRIAIRGLLERRFETELRDLTRSTVEAALGADASIAERIFGLVRDDDGPQLAAYVQREMTDEQLHELLMQRSVYHLKEADPHTFAVPRLRGRAKAALMEIQFDEYGAGRPDDMHSALFARTLRACGLDDAYGAYVEVVPGYILAASNAMSMFGLHRRLRAAAVGHLAAFEATSALPNRRYARGVRRLGYGDEAARYFDEHVEADAVHEQVAVREMCGALAADEPECAQDILFGVATCLYLDGLAGRRQLAAWRAGESSLRSTPGQEPLE